MRSAMKLRAALVSTILLAACASSPDATPVDATVGDAAVDVATDRSPAVDTSEISDASGSSDASVDPRCAVCATYAAVDAGTITAGALDELSGIVESRTQPGIFFVHNDSGDRARFFAVDLEGHLRAEYRLPSAQAVDWEDLALGPCGAGQCLYLADTGDNDLVRAEYAVYRVAVPEVPATVPARVDPVDLSSTALPFRYDDGPHNVEAVAMHPATGDLYLFTKVDTGPVQVFAFPAAEQGMPSVRLHQVATLTLPPSLVNLVTGADFDPCGARLLVRMYTRLLEYDLAPGAALNTLFSGPARDVAFAAERQGEAVGWRADGSGYVTVSEGNNPALHAFRCAAR